MSKTTSLSYISEKTGKPYWGAAADSHYIYTIKGGMPKLSKNISDKTAFVLMTSFAVCNIAVPLAAKKIRRVAQKRNE